MIMLEIKEPDREKGQQELDLRPRECSLRPLYEIMPIAQANAERVRLILKATSPSSAYKSSADHSQNDYHSTP